MLTCFITLASFFNIQNTTNKKKHKNKKNRKYIFLERIKTFCNSYEDVMNSDQASCG